MSVSELSSIKSEHIQIMKDIICHMQELLRSSEALQAVAHCANHKPIVLLLADAVALAVNWTDPLVCAELASHRSLELVVCE